MASHLAIVAYRALVGGLPTGRVDIQVRWFDEDDAARVRQRIESEPALTSYHNPYGEVVSWERSGILAIDTFEPRESGEEVVGFIASTEELSGLA